MRALVRAAVVLFVWLSLITGAAYPLAITAIARLAFPEQTGGSLLRVGGVVIGSSLIGQEFSDGDPRAAAAWFWGRPSGTGPAPYTALDLNAKTGSTGSNLAPTNPALVANVQLRVEKLAAADAAAGLERPSGSRVPVDLVTASGSGLDPHISPASAEYQVPRVARTRGMSEEELRVIVARHTTSRSLGVLGEPVVNVLELNSDLAAASK